MPAFSEGDLVVDTRGRVGTVLKCYKNLVGIFYDIMSKGEILSLPEEEIRLKDD